MTSAHDYLATNEAMDATREERQAERAMRAYHAQFMAHPHPRDPDHPEPIEQGAEA